MSEVSLFSQMLLDTFVDPILSILQGSSSQVPSPPSTEPADVLCLLQLPRAVHAELQYRLECYVKEPSSMTRPRPLNTLIRSHVNLITTKPPTTSNESFILTNNFINNVVRLVIKLYPELELQLINKNPTKTEKKTLDRLASHVTRSIAWPIIFSTTMGIIKKDLLEEDVIYNESVLALGSRQISDPIFNVPPHLCLLRQDMTHPQRPYSAASTLVREITSKKSPEAKLEQLISIVKTIFTTPSLFFSKKTQMDFADIVYIMTYILVNSGVTGLVSELRFMETFLPSDLSNKCVTTFVMTAFKLAIQNVTKIFEQQQQELNMKTKNNHQISETGAPSNYVVLDLITYTIKRGHTIASVVTSSVNSTHNECPKNEISFSPQKMETLPITNTDTNNVLWTQSEKNQTQEQPNKTSFRPIPNVLAVQPMKKESQSQSEPRSSTRTHALAHAILVTH